MLRLQPATAAMAMFEATLPCVFSPGTTIIDIRLQWDGCSHPELVGYGVEATLRSPGATESVAVRAHCAVRLTTAGWTGGLFEWYGLVGHIGLTRYHFDFSAQNPEPRLSSVNTTSWVDGSRGKEH